MKKHKGLPGRLRLPLIVKPFQEEVLQGISQASIIDSENALNDRIKFIHENMKMDVIAEEYIDGRELYASIIGNKKIWVLPIREMMFGDFSEDEPGIAAYKAKWDYNYRQKWGIKNTYAENLANGLESTIVDLAFIRDR
ncbi:MAG: hypothetical protein ABIA63_00205 [bacterium]